MHLYMSGAEVPSWKTLLADTGVEHVSLSFMGLRRRVKHTDKWLLAEKFPANQKIFLDSGAYTVNTADDDRYTVSQLRDIAAAYIIFVQANIDRVEFASEFDCLALGPAWIKAAREDFWDDLPEAKFLPIWHAESGLEELDHLCQKYARVGIHQTALGERNLEPTLKALVRQYGTQLHGVAMTKPAVMAAVPWASVASLSWMSPSQYGDTIVFTGKELKRYPKKYKDQARKRHRTLFTSNGFDAQKIEDDDRDEVLRLSIWSWQQLMLHLDRGEVVTNQPNVPDESNAEVPGDAVVMPDTAVRNAITTAVVPEKRPTTTLPVMGLDILREKYIDVEDGETKERDVSLIITRSSSMRVCDSCFLSAKCPAFLPGSNCAYDIPITIRTKDQMQALQNSLIDMQSQRIMFMKMAEDLEGGYADPNLSSEIDRLQKMIKIKTELEQDMFSVKFEAKGTNGQAGIMSRLFGREAGEKARSLPQEISADKLLVEMDVLDVEVL
jgi:hypothetical protein